MTGKDAAVHLVHTAWADRAQADRETAAREHLLHRGPGRPDDHPRDPSHVPASAVDLVQFALRHSGELVPEDILSALALLSAAHSEVEALEDALLFVARSEGLTWAQIAQARGFKSPQACQQHYTRLTARRKTDA